LLPERRRYACCLQWLGEALGEAGRALYAYVPMTNHVHLLLTPKNAEPTL
jgi:putative transposase